MTDYLTVHQAAKLLGLHPHTVCYHCRTGRIPAVKLAGAWFIAPADAEDAKRRPRRGRGRRKPDDKFRYIN